MEEQLRKLAPGAEIHFKRVAVNDWQIKAWNLPTRPTKTTDSRSRNFSGESVEVDAIPPQRLLDLVAQCVEQHIDQAILQRTLMIEGRERETLRTLARNLTA